MYSMYGTPVKSAQEYMNILMLSVYEIKTLMKIVEMGYSISLEYAIKMAERGETELMLYAVDHCNAEKIEGLTAAAAEYGFIETAIAAFKHTGKWDEDTLSNAWRNDWETTKELVRVGCPFGKCFVNQTNSIFFTDICHETRYIQSISQIIDTLRASTEEDPAEVFTFDKKIAKGIKNTIFAAADGHHPSLEILINSFIIAVLQSEVDK